jgi:hypothetical protein
MPGVAGFHPCIRMTALPIPHHSSDTSTISVAECPRPSWSERYGQRHRLVRITEFPTGVSAPNKVRLYFRRDHFVLQWWDPGARATCSDRVNGDLVAAIFRARSIEERLTHFKTSGQGRYRRLSHTELADRYQADLQRRADAGEIDTATVRRYGAALAHYRAFCTEPEAHKAFPYAANINRAFRLGFSAFLASRRVSPNGRAHGTARPMKGQTFVLDTVRAMLEWAADPDRGNLLPEGFRNPFLRLSISHK